jgi:hypothetical protein
MPRVNVKNKLVNLNALNIYFGQDSYNNDYTCQVCDHTCKEDLFHSLCVCQEYS